MSDSWRKDKSLDSQGHTWKDKRSKKKRVKTIKRKRKAEQRREQGQ